MSQRVAEELQAETQIGYLDQAVAEVFQLMMGVTCLPSPSSSASSTSTVLVDGSTAAVFAPVGVTAVVGLAGSLSGACVLRMREGVALKLAELMTGEPAPDFDRTVKDALGEACNMLAGTWKGKLEEFSASCMLSVPAVISGTSYEFHLPKPAFHLERDYRFEGCAFTFCIDCAGL